MSGEKKYESLGGVIVATALPYRDDPAAPAGLAVDYDRFAEHCRWPRPPGWPSTTTGSPSTAAGWSTTAAAASARTARSASTPR
ncbi:hypothetical protein [Actinomadura logoneensis]|uniref:hypothetical protein n=1 Tax=Actinomadura logoneensis TaxID=2293572 RepID=UPI001F34F788|nr:hypothetical protein [Actinomadura logoneensis]